MAITNIEEIKNSVDIVDVIGSYIELKKAGSNYKAVCPFHSEKTGSFVVSPSKQIYKCFGCQAGGDVIKFVQEIERLEFYEAVEKIANEYNIAIKRDSEVRKDYSRLLTKMQEFFVKSLRDKDIEYLKSRGLKRATIREWGLGYAPRSAAVLKFIRDMQLPMGGLKEIGVIREGENKVYSHFAERIMIPIFSDNNKLLGWSGRSLKKEIKAKYLNSIESVVFNKSRIFFGLNKAKKFIYDKNFMIIMEGQFDVILAHQAGIRTAVATQGTALTDSHIRTIKKIGCRVVLAFDGDSAGINASIKNAKALAVAGVRGRVVLFRDGQDAADMVAGGKIEELKKLLSSGVEFVEFILKNIINSKANDAYGKDEALKECIAFLKELNSEVLFIEYKKRVYDWLGLEIEDKKSIVTREKKKLNKEPVLSVAESILYSAMCNESYIDIILDIVDDEAWGELLPVWQELLRGEIDEEFKIRVELLGAKVLDEESLISLCKAVELAYLKRVKKNTTDMTTLIAINKRIALLMA